MALCFNEVADGTGPAVAGVGGGRIVGTVVGAWCPDDAGCISVMLYLPQHSGQGRGEWGGVGWNMVGRSEGLQGDDKLTRVTPPRLLSLQAGLRCTICQGENVTCCTTCERLSTQHGPGWSVSNIDIFYLMAGAYPRDAFSSFLTAYRQMKGGLPTLQAATVNM